MGDLLKLAPTILGFLGGPAGGLAGAGLQFLASKLGAPEATQKSIQETLQGWSPENTIAIRKIDVEFQEFCMDNDIKIQLAQIAVNTEEAKSTNWFVSGWRPYIGWGAGTSFLYSALFEPFLRFIAQVGFGYKGTFPVIDTTITLQVLFALLGMTAYRSYEKVKGVSN
jgi:hypothetical protein